MGIRKSQSEKHGVLNMSKNHEARKWGFKLYTDAIGVREIEAFRLSKIIGNENREEEEGTPTP